MNGLKKNECILIHFLIFQIKKCGGCCEANIFCIFGKVLLARTQFVIAIIVAIAQFTNADRPISRNNFSFRLIQINENS